MSEEMRIRKLAENIVKDFNITIKDRVDAVLELDAISYQNLGIDSTKTEKNKVKSDSKYLYKLIKGIDEQTGNLLINHLDA
tara:strand:- start:3941 stop:4183 length:243 start_codon:yes stop_codon:yes gene_type:complete